MKNLFFLKSCFIIIICIICIPISVAQNKNIDSLRTLIKTGKPDTNQVKHLNLLAQKLSGNNIDTSIILSKQALQLSLKQNWKQGVGMSYVWLGWYTYLQGKYSEALDYDVKALNTAQETSNKKMMSKALGNIGLVFVEQAYYTKALDYYLKALKIDEELNNKSGILRHLLNIGIVYINQSDYSKALDYNLKALKIAEKIENKELQANALGNIGSVYLRLDDYQKTQFYYFKALKIAEELSNKSLIATLYGNIGHISQKQGNYAKALDYCLKALEMSRETGDVNSISINLTNIGTIYSKTGRFREAELYLKQAINLKDSIGAPDELRQTEEALSQLYDTLGRHKEALIHYKKAVELKDSIFSQENRKQLASEEINYEFDKKIIIAQAEQDKKDALTIADKKKQKVILILVSCGLLLVFVFAGFVFRNLRITRKQKDLIELQKNEVSGQKEIAEKQKHLLEVHQKEIVDSITYAKDIQTALLTSDEYISNNLPGEHFILFKPKDIVSGDFYWAQSVAFLPGWDLGTNKIKLPRDAKRKDIFYIATADCTGHGVPGAFMSMLNISYLNENLMERGIRLPHDILNAQRSEIITALNPVGSTEESKDGMDCVLCAYDFDKMLLHFAAANNPLWLIRNEELSEYKADKMPVGKYTEAKKSFTLQTIELLPGDIIYTSTDGFADQFGTSDKKLMKKRLKEELVKIHKQPMSKQKEYLNDFFENWKGDKEQVDDVTIIGIRI